MKRFGTRYYIAAGILIAVAIVVTIPIQKPFSSQVVVMTTGAQGGYYDQLGQHYKARFAREGVELRLLPSDGSGDNLKRLNDPHSGVDVGFVQGGTTDESKSPDLLSLGTLGYEPLWFFYRGPDPGPSLEGLRGKKTSIGPEGSGSRALALKLLACNGIEPGMAELLPLSPAESAEQLQHGELAAILIMASWETPLVRRLLADPQIELINFARADAYVALYPFLSKLVLPAGVGNMAENRPPVDTNLLAPKTCLIIRSDLAEPIQYLLLEAATEIHSGPGIFQKSGQFPASEKVDLPLSKPALQFYKSGLPFLQRYLPFPLAAIAVSLLVVLIPLIGILFPLLRLLPALYGWSMRRRIFNLYGEMKLIEVELEAGHGASHAELLDRLDRLELRAIHTTVPKTFAHLIYTLRHHISLVRARLEQLNKSPANS